MFAVFWFMTIVMTGVAFAFPVRPLVRHGRAGLALGLGIAVPMVAVSTYLALGSPVAASGHTAAPAAKAIAGRHVSGQSGRKAASVSSMSAALAARLEANPGDGKGWLLLARSYRHLGRPEDAAAAYSRAVALGEHDTDLEDLTGRTPNEPVSGVQIGGSLSLSTAASAIVHADDTVFIFARPPNTAGPPAAVLQLPASALPIDFLLNDTQSMVPGVSLSDFEVVEVTARISRSGIATEALQGLQAKSGPVTIAAPEQLTLVIE